ncbi:3-hydroxyacyl-CoA dehydrogenase NAD-binding domain-containing protein, partial [Novosphingobium sp.]
MRTVAVIGAGQMGSGIAQTVAQFGMKVLLSDVD